ncbi:hypothetical protein AB3Y40_04550 [Yoonia sp. R2331]|uniref:hypothetical protein n=1 Tax=Yoonia sp. R2331 TaxID=3237238 RepID=UPI0034E52F44
MRWWLGAALAVLLASQAGAQSAPPQCQAFWDRFVGDLSELRRTAGRGGAVAAGTILDRGWRVSDDRDGWCRVTATRDLRDLPFSSIRWQADGVTRYLMGEGFPSRIRIAVDDVMLDGRVGKRPFDLSIGLSREDGDPALRLDALYLLTTEGRGMQVTGTLGGAYFDTRASAALSLGSLRLHRVTARVDDVWAILDAFDLDGGSVKRDATHFLRGLRDGLSEAQFDAQSFESARYFMGVLPNAKGVLTVTLSSEQGLGLLQYAMAANAFEAQDKSFADVVSVALHGAAVTVDWAAAAR